MGLSKLEMIISIAMLLSIHVLKIKKNDLQEKYGNIRCSGNIVHVRQYLFSFYLNPYVWDDFTLISIAPKMFGVIRFV